MQEKSDDNAIKSLRLKTIVNIVFFVVVALFLVLYLRRIDLKQLAEVRIQWHFLLIATLFGLSARYLGAYIWYSILRGLGAQRVRHLAKLFYVYAKAWLARYIPGTAPWLLGKIYFASQLGLSKKKLAVSSFLEGGLWVVVTSAVSILLIVFGSQFFILSRQIRYLLIIGLILCVVAILPPVFNFAIKTLYKLVRKQSLETEHLVTSKIVIKNVLLCVPAALLHGVALFFVVRTVNSQIDSSYVAYIIGTSSLAASLSMLAIFIPSGLGIREGIQFFMLSYIMPAEIALAAVILTRLWSLGTDIVFFFSAKAASYITSTNGGLQKTK